MDIILKQIAKKYLLLDTLEAQNSDNLDFTEQSVWNIKDALTAAYQAGGRVCVRFARKPSGWWDVVAAAHDADAGTYMVQIQEHRHMAKTEYDSFVEKMMADYDWLRGNGGYVNPHTRQVVKITCIGQPTIFVDPSGYAYARYVGLEVG